MRISLLKILVVFTFAVFLAFLLFLFVTRTNKLEYLLPQVDRDSSQIDENLGSSVKPRFQVLKDGTVIHIGNVTTTFTPIYFINCNSICNDFNTEGAKLLIVVESTASNFKKRLAIRNSWALKMLQDVLNYRVVFLLASDKIQRNQARITSESWRYNDLIQMSFEETYENVAFKSIAYLNWFLSNCRNADFIFKTDDDIFIHVPNLFKTFLSVLSLNDSQSIMCHENRVRKILRKQDMDNSSHRMAAVFKKYAVEDIPGKYYPHYCAGFGYGFTKHVADKLYAATRVTPYVFLEDVLITGFCREKAHLTIKDIPNLTLRPPVTMQDVCSFYEGRINSHELNELEMKELWQSINTHGYKCPTLLGFVH